MSRVGWVKRPFVLPTIRTPARGMKRILRWNLVGNDKPVTHPT